MNDSPFVIAMNLYRKIKKIPTPFLNKIPSAVWNKIISESLQAG